MITAISPLMFFFLLSAVEVDMNPSYITKYRVSWKFYVPTIIRMALFAVLLCPTNRTWRQHGGVITNWHHYPRREYVMLCPGVGFSAPFVCLCIYLSVCLSVSLFFRTISKKSLQLGSPNLTQKCSTISPGNPPFSLGSKEQRSRSRGTKTVRTRVFGLLWVLTYDTIW